MKFLRFALRLALGGSLVTGRAEDPGAKTKADALLTRFLRIPPSFCCGDETPHIGVPLVVQSLEPNAKPRMIDDRAFLEKDGVAFPPGAEAVYFPDELIVRVINTAENFRRTVEEIDRANVVPPPTQLRVEVRVVEFSPEVEKELGGRVTFADLQRKLKLKPICVESVLSTSGWVTYGAEESSARQGPAKAALVDDWPPEAGAAYHRLRVELNSGLRGAVEYEVDFRLALPASGHLPALRETVKTSVHGVAGQIDLLKTFVVESGNRPARHFAMLSRCEVVDPLGGAVIERPPVESGTSLTK